MKTVSQKTVFTYDYKDEHGRWRRGCNEMDTIKEIESIIHIIGAREYKIIKRITTVKEKVIA